MIRWSLVDTARVPGGGELRLMQRQGVEFSIMAGRLELMNSRRGRSEEALARLACERLRGRPAARLLIGGLGMGFTLRAALAELGPKARVVVAELVPEVVAWAWGPLAAVHGDSLSDPRVEVRETDVAAEIAAAASSYDAILLDVDNGPEGLTRDGNDCLYDASGLQAARTALRPGGVLAIWSAGPDKAFVRSLDWAGFKVEEAVIRAGGARHVVWLAAAPGGKASG
jgi:spermidine synthase